MPSGVWTVDNGSVKWVQNRNCDRYVPQHTDWWMALYGFGHDGLLSGLCYTANGIPHPQGQGRGHQDWGNGSSLSKPQPHSSPQRNHCVRYIWFYLYSRVNINIYTIPLTCPCDTEEPNLAKETTQLIALIVRFMGPSWGQTGPRWAPFWPHEPCYLGCLATTITRPHTC